jgi:phosphoribosylaminoimidazolecarboxamide formyltransferase/IMP cyclohydrolase
LAYDRAIVTYLARLRASPRSLPVLQQLQALLNRFFNCKGSCGNACATGKIPIKLPLGMWWIRLPLAGTGLSSCRGKELSYNNLLDLEAARALAAELTLSNADATLTKGSVSSGSARKFLQPEQAVAVVVKHNNPCGVAIRPSPSCRPRGCPGC